MREENKRAKNTKKSEDFPINDFFIFPFTAAQMMSFNVWMKVVYRYHLSVIKNMIVKMEKMKRIVIFLCLIAQKENSSVKDYWVEWVVLVVDAFFNVFDVMEVSYAHHMNTCMLIVIFLTDNDCGDWSDEENCPKKSILCTSNEFKCDDGRCIPLRWKCDQEQDCDSGEDEKDCSDIGNVNRECSDDEYTCKDSRCILKNWVCDGTPDCKRGEDEADCDIKCDVGQFKVNDLFIMYTLSLL